MNEEKDKKETAPETEAQPVPEEPQESPAEEKTDKKADKKDEKKEKKFGRKKEDERVAALEAEKEALEKDKAALNDKYLRICAEYDNFRRRSQKEKENIYTDVRGETLKKFLPVNDSLNRALMQTAEEDPARKGLEMIMTQYENALTQLGVSLIEAVGQPFDANFHNAVMHVEDESVGENIVVEEFEKGFKIGDKVLRYSVVKVAN